MRTAATFRRLVSALAVTMAISAIVGGREPPRRVPVLVYHSIAAHIEGETAGQRAYRVSPAAFEAQMRYLRDNAFHVVALSSLVADLRGGPVVPARSVVITFDDGWVTQYRDAWPILQHFGFTATFFVFPNPIGRDARFMTWDQLHVLLRAGMTIGSHSRTHPRMTTLTPQSLRDEVGGSRRALESRMGTAVEFFSYPFGEHPPEVEAAVRDAGYRAARGFPGGPLNGPEDLWALRSVMVTDSLAAFRRQVEPPGRQ